MDLPHRRALDAHALDENIAAVVGLNEIGPQAIASSKEAFSDGNPFASHADEAVAVGFRHSLPLPARLGLLLFPAPPHPLVGLAVEGAAAGDGDILLAEGVDEGGIVHALDPLIAREHDGQVGLRVGLEEQGRSLDEMEIDAAFKMDGAGEKGANGYDDAAAAGL